MREYFKEKLKKNKLFLAPLAGVSDAAFRQSVRECGAQNVFAVTEMISAKGLYYNNQKTKDLYYFYDGEENTGVQIFGSDENVMAYAVKEYLNNHPCEFIDLNFGCPVRKVVSNKEGSALLADTKKLSSVAKAVVAASVKPVSAKIRLGTDEENINVVENAKALEGSGISLIAVHLRTAKAMYSGSCEYEYIDKIKSAVTIPVIANGDIKTPEDVRRIVSTTSADGIMIGRGAMKDPFVFKKTAQYLETGEYDETPLKELFHLMRRNLLLNVDYKGELVALRQFRTSFASYTKGLKDSCMFREKINRTNKLNDVVSLLDAYEEILK